VLGMLLFAFLVQRFCGLQVNYPLALVYGLFGAVAGVMGDLSMSVIKRQAGIKDYGRLIPGHGGILDRFDSVMITAPLTEVLVLIIPFLV
jgi:phosphatidate cytidylyltransferase